MKRFPYPSIVITLLASSAVFLMAGCCCTPHRASQWPSTQSATQAAGLQPPFPVAQVDAWCDPPVGWRPKPVEGDSHYTQYVWVSPSGATAYGVTRIRLPLPLGPDFILWGYVGELRRREGEAAILSKTADSDLPGLRTVVEGRKYRIRINLAVRGSQAWAIYAGTLRSKPIDENELRLAESAREHTRVDPVAQEAAAR